MSKSERNGPPNGGNGFQKLVARCPGGDRTLEVGRNGHDYLFRLESGLSTVRWEDLEGGRALLEIDGAPREVRVTRTGDGAYRIEWGGRQVVVRVEDDLARRARMAHAHAAGPVAVRSPMPGTVVKILVREGQEVALEQPVMIVEAMKMQNELPAPAAGTVARVAVEPGQAVDGDQLLLEIRA